MVATDKRLHLFLKYCVKADYASKACTQYLDFSSITFRIKTNHYNYFLQPSIKQLKRVPKIEEEGYSKMKLRGNNNDGNSRVINNNMVDEWKLRANESYKTIFKDKVKNGPTLLIVHRGCHKYHNKGWCYPNCNNKALHTKLIRDDFTAFGAYCKLCRGK